MNNVIEKFRGGLVVSCHSDMNDPFDSPEYLALFARAAQMGGAVGVRAQGIGNINAIRRAVELPVIGTTRGMFGDDWILITPDFSDIAQIVAAGAHVVAIDATARRRPNGMDGCDFLREARARFDVTLMADCSQFEEGIAAAEAGADLIATTLSGYTSETESQTTEEPDFDLLKSLVRAVSVPVIAEGRIWTPDQAKYALDCGAYAVVVGTAITRPRVVTEKFVEALGKRTKRENT